MLPPPLECAEALRRRARHGADRVRQSAPVSAATDAVDSRAEPPAPPLAPPPPVVPLTRSPIRSEAPPPLADAGVAASSACSVTPRREARPCCTCRPGRGRRFASTATSKRSTARRFSVRTRLKSLLLTLMPERDAEALRTGAASEWICEIADLGRVRCMTFRDHAGPGGVFRLMRPRGISVEQLGLAARDPGARVRADGLVLVAGPRSSGKRTLMSAFVDLINKKRREHVITIESEISVAHDRVGALVSQREVRGGADEMLAEARAALREDPDVLVLENLRTPDLMHLALDAAARGQLVIGGLAASSAADAIDRIIDLYPAEQRRQVQLSLGQSLRGVVAQVLLKKTGGGRVAAREVLLKTPAVRSVLAEGKTSQLPLAIEGGRAAGMTPLNDALVGFVQSGAVDVREAYRHAADRPGFLALLKRQGLDTSALEKLA